MSEIRVYRGHQLPDGLPSPDVFFTPGYGRAATVADGGDDVAVLAPGEAVHKRGAVLLLGERRLGVLSSWAGQQTRACPRSSKRPSSAATTIGRSAGSWKPPRVVARETGCHVGIDRQSERGA